MVATGFRWRSIDSPGAVSRRPADEDEFWRGARGGGQNQGAGEENLCRKNGIEFHRFRLGLRIESGGAEPQAKGESPELRPSFSHQRLPVIPGGWSSLMTMNSLSSGSMPTWRPTLKRKLAYAMIVASKARPVKATSKRELVLGFRSILSFDSVALSAGSR
jgi:hypothetical protein